MLRFSIFTFMLITVNINHGDSLFVILIVVNRVKDPPPLALWDVFWSLVTSLFRVGPKMAATGVV